MISKEKNKVVTEIHAVFPAENRWFKHDFLKYDFYQSALWQRVAHCKMPCGPQVEKHCTKALQNYLKLGSVPTKPIFFSESAICWSKGK